MGQSSKPGGDFTYAGAFDNAFAGYSRALATARGARVAPLVDTHAPDQDAQAGPYFGTVGRFQATPALPYMPGGGVVPQEYMGNLPLGQQPQIHLTEPWLMDDA